jgi:hypothetical protein
MKGRMRRAASFDKRACDNGRTDHGRVDDLDSFASSLSLRYA